HMSVFPTEVSQYLVDFSARYSSDQVLSYLDRAAALKVLVVARLPFNVPTDPVFAARSQQFEDPFNQYAVPQSVLRFRQGFGRLIRGEEDRGVVVVLDPRILSRSYGPVFLESLPNCTVVKGSLRELSQAVKQWIAKSP
ncbi:MAG: helicase C-terminal domain-containing protein, partial [Dehalococcoidia bacterium]|nr:helicase C-terminal domain-containing protein [Dehalococcoidia bacterium]